MKIIEIDSWKRKRTFKRFYKYDFPYVSICSPIDITNLVLFSKHNQESFYSVMTWAVLKSLNEIEELRLRIIDNQVVLFDRIMASVCLLNSDNTFRYSKPITYYELKTFCAEFKSITTKIEHIEKTNRYDLAYISCVPTIRITSVQHPMRLYENDSIPRICWGKYELQNDRYMIDISIQVHHSLCDGMHMSKFISNIQETSQKLKSI